MCFPERLDGPHKKRNPAVAGAGLVSVGQRPGITAQDEPAIGGLLDIPRRVETRPAKRLLPEQSAGRISAHDPEIAPAVVWTRLRSARARPRLAHENETSVTRLPDCGQCITAGSAKGLLPNFLQVRV